MDSAGAINAASWFLINLKIGTLSFGGSGRALLFEEEIVERRPWLSVDEFREVLTLAQGLPGPNLINICVYLGYQLVGWPGVVAGLLGLSLPGAFAVVVVYWFLDFQNQHVASMFQGMSLGSMALVAMLCTKVGKGLVTEGKALASDGRAVARFGVALGVAVASLKGVPIQWVLLLGVALGLAVEFAP
jgi:chromate transporter